MHKSNLEGAQHLLMKSGRGLSELVSRDHAVGIEHEFLRRALVEVLVALDRLVQGHNGDVDGLGDFDLVVQDRHHELPVVLHNRTLTGGKDMGFRPSQADADAEVSRLGALIGRTGIFGHVQSGNAEGSAGAGNLS